MSQTRQDLNDIIDAAQGDANNLLAAAGTTKASIQAAANRVSALPPSSDDFQAEVNKIGVIRDTLAQATTIVAEGQSIADQIAPSP